MFVVFFVLAIAGIYFLAQLLRGEYEPTVLKVLLTWLVAQVGASLIVFGPPLGLMDLEMWRNGVGILLNLVIFTLAVGNLMKLGVFK